MISKSHIEQFRTEGYVVLYDFFDPAQELSALADSYIELLDALGTIFIQNANPDLHKAYSGLPFPERLAMLIGLSGGSVLYHLDPTLIHLRSHFTHRSN